MWQISPCSLAAITLMTCFYFTDPTAACTYCDNPRSCNKQGVCDANNCCLCNGTFTGYACNAVGGQLCACATFATDVHSDDFPSCYNGGTCEPTTCGKCICAFGYTGKYCEISLGSTMKPPSTSPAPKSATSTAKIVTSITTSRATIQTRTQSSSRKESPSTMRSIVTSNPSEATTDLGALTSPDTITWGEISTGGEFTTLFDSNAAILTQTQSQATPGELTSGPKESLSTMRSIVKSKPSETTTESPAFTKPNTQTGREISIGEATCSLIYLENMTLPRTGVVIYASGPLDQKLSDTNSDVFRELAEIMSPKIAQLYEDFEVISINITAFRRGSIISDYIVTLRTLTTLSDAQIQAMVNEKLAKLRQGIVEASQGGFKWNNVQSATVKKYALSKKSSAAPKKMNAQPLALMLALVASTYFEMWHY